MPGQGDPLGRLALLIIFLVLFYDTVFGLVKIGVQTIYNGFDSFLDLINNMIILWGGTEPLFPTTGKLLNDLFGWEMFLFTNATAFAILLFIDLIKTAYRA